MVVVAVLPNGQYGTASAATVAKDMIRSFRNIRFGLMVGIGGGAPTKQHDIRLGDVVVSSPTSGQSGVFQYDFGKATEEVFQHTASHNKPPPLLLAAVAGLKTQYERKGLQIHDKVSTIVANNKRLSAKYGRPEDPDSLFFPSIGHKSDPCHRFCVTAATDLIDRTPRQEPMEDVEVHYGTIASGNTLMKDAFKRDELASKAGILCFEMEAAGLMDGFRCLVIRGICDYSDSHKNDSWQGYAAMTAAVYAKQILSRIRPEAVAREETMISKIDEVISGVKNLKRSIAEQKVLNWLSDEDFGTYQFDERSKKAPGTCQWFLDSPEYQSWTQQKGQVLFCPGIAGAGKTVLASATIENLHSRFQSDSSTAIVHIYCRYNRVDRQTFNELRASLLRQLCERLSPLPEGIMQLYDQYKPRRVEAPPKRILSELESVSGLFSKVFMVIDALDEWRAAEHADLYSLPGELLFLHKKLAINLLATSRHLPLIANRFSNYPCLPITAQQQDIDAYVDSFRWPESSCIGRTPGLRDKEMSPWHLAALFGLRDLAVSRMENPDVDARDSCGRTALVLAMECLAFGFNMKPEFAIRFTPNLEIYAGIDVDRCCVVEDLLASGANPHMLGYGGNTPLHFAAILGDVKIIEKLLDCGADVHISNKSGDIPLVLAVRHGRELACMKLLELGTVDMCGENRRTALIEAASVKDLTLMETLIEAGATVDLPDVAGQTALMEASKHGHAQIVKLLLENKSDVDHQDHNRDTALMKACRDIHTDVIELLLGANARLGIMNAVGETAFSNAGRRSGDGDVKQLLRRHSTDPGTRDQHSGIALISASTWGKPGIISLILEDAESKPTSKYLDLALSTSCSTGGDKVARLLIDHGANPNMSFDADYPPKSLLTRAIYSRHDSVALMLIDAGINIENEDFGSGPIHAAAAVGSKTVVQSLIERGISVNHRASEGRLPLDYALSRQDKDTSIADFLRERGAITERERLVQYMRNRRKKLE
ncbi:hypothetical protein FOVSG1_008287 [Fusarium oxysporum f. sp. vasinfectum]